MKSLTIDGVVVAQLDDAFAQMLTDAAATHEGFVHQLDVTPPPERMPIWSGALRDFVREQEPPTGVVIHMKFSRR